MFVLFRTRQSGEKEPRILRRTVALNDYFPVAAGQDIPVLLHEARLPMGLRRSE